MSNQTGPLKASEVWAIRCDTCTYGRKIGASCDIHGTPVNATTVCRSYRRPGQTHVQARSRFPVLERLRPGVVYVVAEIKGSSRRFVRALFSQEPVQRAEPELSVGDALSESHEISVRNIDGSESAARIDCYESGLVVLTMKDVRYGSFGNAFEALETIRIEMERDGRMPLVNGANRNAFVTGMAISMAHGFVACMGKKDGTSYETALTFGTDHVTDTVYVAEQLKFKQWFFEKNSGYQEGS